MLEDPQNVGTLLRSAEAAGVHGVLFPTHRQAPLTPSAVKASAGAVEHLLLAPVDDLARALTDLRGHGLRVAGAEADAPLTARQSDLRGPLVIVVGSEGQGLGPAVRRRGDLFMRIPMRGAVGSLNAAVAGPILLFEAVAQRDPEGRGRRRQPVDGGGRASTAVEADEATPEPRTDSDRRSRSAGSRPTTVASRTEESAAPPPGRRRRAPAGRRPWQQASSIQDRREAQGGREARDGRQAEGSRQGQAAAQAAGRQPPSRRAHRDVEGQRDAQSRHLEAQEGREADDRCLDATAPTATAESQPQAQGRRQAVAMTGERRAAGARLTRPVGRPYHSPAPE